jgi:hypothetical protein
MSVVVAFTMTGAWRLSKPGFFGETRFLPPNPVSSAKPAF